MELKSVSIENFKGIEKCNIHFENGFNLLIGNNGYGKTSILEAVSVCLGGFVAGIEDIKTKHFTTDEIRIVLEKIGDGSFNKRYMTPVVVRCEAIVENESFEWNRKKNSLRASRTTVEPRDICRKAFTMANERDHILPILSYQSTARMWMQKRESSENIFATKFYRTIGYESCLVEAANIKMLMNWVRHMERQEWKRKETIGEFQGVKNTLCSFMEYMTEENILSFEYDEQSEELVFITKELALPIRSLSAGYQSLIWMVLDISIRMALLNPDLLEDINKAPGIVLIDELDMHLHPRWQWKIVGALKAVFPNVQFIAATHSPIIIASCKGENLIKITDLNELEYMETPYGLDVNDTLDVCQGSLPIAEEIKKMMDVFNGKLDDDDFDAAELVLEHLVQQLGMNHPEVIRAQTTLDLEKIPLED